MSTKVCGLCGRRLDISQFLTDRNRCKSCHAEIVRERRWGKCPRCGGEFYKGNGYKLCKNCRGKKEIMSLIPCYKCPFERECKDNIWRETFTPYCFVTAKYHGLYESEQQKRGVVTGYEQREE